jgi:hypothetical protein
MTPIAPIISGGRESDTDGQSEPGELCCTRTRGLPLAEPPPAAEPSKKLILM